MSYLFPNMEGMLSFLSSTLYEILLIFNNQMLLSRDPICPFLYIMNGQLVLTISIT